MASADLVLMRRVNVNLRNLVQTFFFVDYVKEVLVHLLADLYEQTLYTLYCFVLILMVTNLINIAFLHKNEHTYLC